MCLYVAEVSLKFQKTRETGIWKMEFRPSVVFNGVQVLLQTLRLLLQTFNAIV